MRIIREALFILVFIFSLCALVVVADDYIQHPTQSAP